jgi:hypothetical protein
MSHVAMPPTVAVAVIIDGSHYSAVIFTDFLHFRSATLRGFYATHSTVRLRSEDRHVGVTDATRVLSKFGV